MSNLKNFNVLIPDTGASQLSYFVIRGLNQLSESHPQIDAILFYENHHKNCLPANFATMQISDAWFQTGPTIATSFSTASKLINFPCGKKFFYVWDLEWIRNEGITKQYEQYYNIYCDESLEIISRSDSHKHAIENAFNRKVNHVISDFNATSILEILK